MLRTALAAALALAACSACDPKPNQPEADEDPNRKVGVPACDELLEDLQACAKKHPEAKATREAFRRVFLSAVKSVPKEDLEKTCNVQRSVAKNDFRRFDDCS